MRVKIDTKDFFPSLFHSSPSDLRQDMLTLQVIQLMENLWKKEGLDLRWELLSKASVDTFAQYLVDIQHNTVDFALHSQDDPIWLLVHWEQDGAHRGSEELRHHRQYPTQQQ